MTTAVVGRRTSFSRELAARLAATDRPGDAGRVVVTWELDRDCAGGAGTAAALESSVLSGLASSHATLATGGGVLDRILHVVALTGGEPASSTLHAFVEAFAKSLAREVAREATTVNVVAAHAGSPAALDYLADACAYLLSEDAGFVTGQSFTDWAPGAPAPVDGSRHAAVSDSRTVLVSGGGGAIGSAIVRRLLGEGWSVVIGQTASGTGQRLVDELGAAAGRSRAVLLDLTELGREGPLGAEVVEAIGPLDGIVLCGGWNRTGPFVDTAAGEWRKTLAVNLTGAISLVDAMRANLAETATIVGIGSESARIGDRGRAVYAGAKAGLAAWLRGPDPQRPRIRAATVSPGPVDTPLMRQTHGDSETASRQLQALRRLVPLGRLGTPEEVAGAVAFLLSPAGGAFTGTTLSVGGGITMQ